jgi:ribosomal protein S18 acetylase RimI-like enzyme
VTFRFAVEPLSKDHDRSAFRCGNDRIDAYFRHTVSQDVRRNYATSFVAREIATGRIAGFYTLSASNIPLLDVPQDMARKLPRYPTVPAVLIGWLARDIAFRGDGVGELLVLDAIKTVAAAPIGAHAIFAEAIDERAVAFYRALGFMALARRPRTLFLPLATVRGTVGRQAP